METNICYFANGMFYPGDIEYNKIPTGAVKVSAEDFAKAMNRSPGETYTVDNDGIVTIIPAPTITHEQHVAQAEYQRSQLRAKADSEIVWREDAVEDGSATEEEITSLTAWRKYRMSLMRTDTSKAPDVEWPSPPCK